MCSENELAVHKDKFLYILYHFFVSSHDMNLKAEFAMCNGFMVEYSRVLKNFLFSTDRNMATGIHHK